jgi:hypothetical protein
MAQTIELLNKALKTQHASAWAREFNIDRSTLSQAKRVGRLSPALAGNLAIELGENAEHWIAVAAIEAEKDSPLLERLKRSQALRRKL